MKLILKNFGLAFCCIFLLNSHAEFCQVKLPRLVSDGMVLQRDSNVRIWGWASPGEKITINFIDKTYTTESALDGEWKVSLSALKAGGPYSMEISASNHITIKNILIGDVWVCSGQSNMVLPMERVKDRYENVIAGSDNLVIRQFLIPMKYDFNTPHGDFESGSWESANPENVLHFTAAGYFFARTLFEKYRVPIGLINASVGGSPAEAWLSEEALNEFPTHKETLEKFKDSSYVNQILTKDKTRTDAWYNLLRKEDKGLANGEKPWFDTTYDASTWSVMHVPAYWEDEGLEHVNGVVWFKKEIDIQVAMTGKPAQLLLGRIVDADSVYVNGKFVGTTSYQYPPRKYEIPPDLLKEGKNIIVVRVINNIGKGGFVKDKPYEIKVDGQTIDLKGDWQYKLGVALDPLPGPTFIQYQPTGLFNGMIAPLLNYDIKGVIWYQGESNTNRARGYRKLFPDLITDWRQKWNKGNFPFLYVQLANFMEAKELPSESEWAELREAQFKTLAVPKTAMTVATDIGEWNDIHPLNKEDVGYRLALAAMKVAYGDTNIVSSGPLYQSMIMRGNKIIITFSNTGSGLITKGEGELKYFAIAGADKKFVWANAKIEGNKVLVWSEQVNDPVFVRYAWADNPEGANLYNKEGLPASSFRTDE